MGNATDSLSSLDALPLPAELARELCHLPGFVFLDSSAAEASQEKNNASLYSIITACPKATYTGNLFTRRDREFLQCAYHSQLRPDKITPDIGVPTAGFYGTISYEGDFLFGEYHDCLIYDHLHERWTEIGNLSEQRIEHPRRTTFPNAEPLKFTSNVEKEQFCKMVSEAQEYIAAGHIYQVNLSHRFSAPRPDRFDAFAFHEQLREQSPAPFAGFLSLGEYQVISSSPEQFLNMSGSHIQTRPIKGTRPRFRNREEDEKSAYDLITSPKEIAELVMITDLERNDLGQICEFGSVQATELLKLERFAQVFHLVSTVEGTLRPEIDHIDALLACYPGGSITGAPKKRAREIIDELESVPRGLYTGAIGCLGFNGESRFNIAIRTAIADRESVHFHVGAGIVADSNPAMEWEETLHKAAGIFQACGGS
ncbi:anthranilate synthase component I family protein [Verrucomicrobiales bacterium BCK34]|nr:anthranilate synthase component I family protein [Verrucomicrobiales bacterium BCK34]